MWDTEQLRTFLETVTDDRLFAAWMLVVTTGMRRGEVLGIRWNDVNLDLARVSVVRTLTVVGHDVLVSEPKTAKGRRSVALDPATVATLREHRRGREESDWPSATDGTTGSSSSRSKTAPSEREPIGLAAARVEEP